jgi:hypothetical protein
MTAFPKGIPKEEQRQQQIFEAVFIDNEVAGIVVGWKLF